MVTGKHIRDMPLKGNQMLVVESATYGLCNNKHVIDQIVCQVSEDKTKLLVFLDDMEASKLYRSTIVNLANTAEMISPAC